MSEQSNQTKEVLQPELVFYTSASLLEGPHWDAAKQLLYCVSIEQQIIYAIRSENGEVTSYVTDGPVGCAVVEEDGMILESELDGIYRIHPETKEKMFVAHPNTDKRMRYNDGKLDPNGRLLVGTMSYTEEVADGAALYAIENETVRTVLTDTTLSNGLGWSLDGTKMYFIDTPTKKVGQYHYDLETGAATFEKYIVEIKDGSLPDGMCVDIDGMIWVAQYGGQKVCKWNPETGEKLKEVQMPVKNPTSCCVGGENKDYLYITTAKDGEKTEALAGGLFRVKIR